MSGKGSFADDRLGGYVEVKDRIRLFYEKYPEGRLVTADVRWPAPDDDMPRVAVKAYAYRDPADVHPSVGWSWMVLPGSSSFTKGSELENTETSAWGRAIGSGRGWYGVVHASVAGLKTSTFATPRECAITPFEPFGS